MLGIYEQGLDKNPANFSPITPLSFIKQTAKVYPNKTAVIHGSLTRTWSQTYSRCRQLASALVNAGVNAGDTVAVMLPNTPPMVEAHFGVPMVGAVLNALNTRLDSEAIAFMLNHGEAKVVIVDAEFSLTMKKALAIALAEKPRDILVIDVNDPEYEGPSESLGSIEYDSFITNGDPHYEWRMPSDEWESICLNYTSGTTGNPKGVVYHHRGAAINAISNVLEWDMPKHPVYLWTLPMFHCNGWCFPWTIAARAGINVCLRRVDAPSILSAMRTYNVTHIVLRRLFMVCW